MGFYSRCIVYSSHKKELYTLTSHKKILFKQNFTKIKIGLNIVHLSEIEHEGRIPFVQQHVQILLHDSSFSIYTNNLYGGPLLL